MIKNELLLKEIVAPLIEWYDVNKRDLPWRHNATPYRVWISEIMLQQTRVDPVIPYYLRFMETFPDVYSLAKAPEDLLMKQWEGLGYYSRARNLQKAAKIIADNKEFPNDFDGWLNLPGIGTYTAGAICSIALGLPTPAVDGNVLRVLSRVLCSEEDIAKDNVKKVFTEALRAVYPQGKTSEFTQALMELGATVCLPNGEPLCDRCPLKRFCVASMEGKTDLIPYKSPKKPRKIEERTVVILRCKDKIALRKRPEKGLLAKLWEFPNTEGYKDANVLADEYKALAVKQLDSSSHIFSHIEWRMVGYEIMVDEEDSSYKWITIDDLLSKIAIPSAFRTYLNYIREQRYQEIEK